MPNVLRCPLKRAKPDGHAKESLASPRVTGDEGHVASGVGLGVVYDQVYRLVNVLLQNLFQHVILLVLKMGEGGREGGGREGGRGEGRRTFNLFTAW